jgi:hypothetical protein
MGRLLEVPSKSGQVGAVRLPSAHCGDADSRTLLKQFLLDPVLPMLTLLMMAALTAAILILLVMTVGSMEQSLHSSSLSDDPWSPAGSAPSAAASGQAYADYAAAMAEAQDSWLAARAGD